MVKLGIENLNNQIKPLLVHFYLELKQFGKEDKGLIALLGLFGNPNEIAAELKK
jgi:hypothetical protein